MKSLHRLALNSRVRTSSFALVAILLAGCASPLGNFPLGQQRPTSANPANGYQRSLPALEGYNPGGDFGTVSDREFAITMTPALEWAQARQQCDQKPVAPRAAQRPPMQRQICRGNFMQIARCESQQDQMEERFRQQEAQRLAALPVRYERDCYMTPATPDVKGKLQLRLVPPDASDAAINAGTVLASFSLASMGQQVKVPLPANISNQCLVLTDVSGTPIALRQGGNTFTFANEAMRAQRNLEAQKQKVVDSTRERERLDAEQRVALRSLTTDPQWNGKDRCIAPAQRPEPPVPAGMSWEEATTQAQGYCMDKLGNNLDPRLVISSVKALEEDEYISSYQRYSKSPAACTRKSYDYDPGMIQAIRMFTAINPRDNERRQVLGLLNQCTASVARTCGSHLIAWKERVEEIRAEPRAALERCGAKIKTWSNVNGALEKSEVAATTAQQALTTMTRTGSPQISLQPVPLSSAACRSSI